MPYTSAAYSPLLHDQSHIEDYRLDRANWLRKAQDARGALRAYESGSLSVAQALTCLQAIKKRVAGLQTICRPAHSVMIMPAIFAELLTEMDLAAEAASERRAA